MSTFTDSHREVSYHILDLLQTINEALQHMLVQLDELRLEESSVLLKDTAEAISRITNCALSINNQDDEKELLKSIVDIRVGITMIIDAYEQNDLLAIKTVLTHRVIPAFLWWQEQIVQILRTSVLS